MENNERHNESLHAAAQEFFIAYGHEMNADYHAPLIVEVAKAFIIGDKKSEKIIRELLYDPIVYNELEVVVLPYMGLEKAVPGFKIFWDQLRDHLTKLQFRDPLSFEKILDAIKEKRFKIKITPGVHHGNLFQELKEHLNIECDTIDEFFCSIYNLNTQIGKTPSGKGEYMLDLFVKDSYKSSDVSIEGNEFEIKSTGAAIGESLGSKITYIENIQKIFEQAGKDFNYLNFTFGKKDFKKKWAPDFIALTEHSPMHAKDIFWYQYSFFMQSDPSEDYAELVEIFLEDSTVENLSSVYDLLCRKYVYMALMGKSMILFNEIGSGEKRKPSGDYLTFDIDSVQLAVSFAGSNTDTPAKIVLPKSSATMRPEILYTYNPDTQIFS